MATETSELMRESYEMMQQEPGVRKRLTPSRAKHIRRLKAAEFARRSSRVVRRPSRGQTLIIFALTFTVLIGILGLAVDTIRVYDLYARMQRAAEAGALAGVIYMPNNYTTNLSTSPGDNAVCRAWQETHKNEFGPGCTPGSSIGANYCPKPVSTVEIAVCNVKGYPYQLQVSITESINVLFIGALNVGPVTLTATAIAAYLPPVEIASDPTGTGNTGSWGSFGECGNSGTSASAACTGKTSVRNWSGNINGPGELKEQGDPLVSCAEGKGSPVTLDQSATSLPLLNTTYVGMPTNHPQSIGTAVGSSPTGCGNSDATGAFTGITNYDGVSSVASAPTKAGYAYIVHIPSVAEGGSGVAQSVWVWNAPFSPSPPKSCNGRTGGQNTTSYDIFYYYNCGGSSSSPYPYYPGVTQCGTNSGGFDPYTCLDPKLYFSVTYSIYLLSGPTDMVGTPEAAFTAWPYAGQGSCPNGQYQAMHSPAAPFNTVLPANTCIAAACVANWCPIGNQLGDNVTPSSLWNSYALQPGLYYRVMVTVSDYGDPQNPNLGWGGHSYSLKLCPASGTTQGNVQTCVVGGAIGGWNESDTLFIFPGGGAGSTQTTEYPLGVIDPSFAGRTIDIKLYDPGDLNGTNGSAKGYTLYAVAPPTGAADPCTATTTDLSTAGYQTSNFSFTSGERTSTLNSLPAIEPSLKGDLIYNGLWVDEQVQIPAKYQYASNSWTLCAQAPQTNDSDVLAIGVFALGQSPVHLVG